MECKSPYLVLTAHNSDGDPSECDIYILSSQWLRDVLSTRKFNASKFLPNPQNERIPVEARTPFNTAPAAHLFNHRWPPMRGYQFNHSFTLLSH